MNLYPERYKYLTLAFLLIFVVLSASAQSTKSDTIAMIKDLKRESLIATKSQNFDEAIGKINRAGKLASRIKDEPLKADIHYATANLNYYLQNYEKASSEAIKAIALLDKLNDTAKLASVKLLYGLVLTRTKEYESSERYLKEADNYFAKNDLEAERADVLLGLGILELKKGNTTIALNYLDASIPLFSVHNKKYQEAFAYSNKADALFNLEDKDLDNIEEVLAQSDSLSKANNYTRLTIENIRIAAQIAIARNNTEEANALLNKYLSRKDSIASSYMQAISKGVTSESIGDLNTIIANQKNDLDKQQKSINFTKMTTGLSIALIVILSLLTLSLYKNNNLRAKANELLQDKNNELQLAKEKAEKASLAKAQFLSTITHELRTPLYAVTGLTHLLLEEDPKPHQKEHLNSLKFSGDYLLSLINNILDLNKLEANKVEVEKTTFNLKKRINDVLIALKKSADDRKNKLTLEFDESIPARLVGDPLKLSQILINLIGNSVKFTQNGHVTVRVQHIDQHAKKVALHFEIEDNGVGISKKKQKSIFETFSQGSLQINRKFGGTGLGLSIVKNLLELMNSKIHLESQLGQGSKFWFNISFEVSEEHKDDINANGTKYEVDYLALENRSVLVVEDNKINQMITKKILEKNKMKCMVADNGMDAIKMVEKHTFDVILMDIHMPGISGIEATQKIREFNKEIPIVALTAVTIDENLDDFYRAGFNEIIPKPFKTEEFFEKIYRSIEGTKFPVS